MTWVRLEDTAATHPKSLASGLDVFGLWCAGLCYANLHHTDGHIPKTALRAVFPSDAVTLRQLKRAASTLVEHRRWIETDTEWIIHDYSDHQEEALKANLEQRRAAERERKRAYRAAKKSDTSGKCPSGTGRDMAGHVPADAKGVSQPPGPARPGPARPEVDRSTTSGASSDRSRAKKGTRIAEDWKPPADVYDWARTDKAVRLDREQVNQAADEFRDYWLGVPGQKGCKLDWDRTFKNRLREVRRRNPQLPEPRKRPKGPPPAGPPPRDPKLQARADEIQAAMARGEPVPDLQELIAGIGRPKRAAGGDA